MRTALLAALLVLSARTVGASSFSSSANGTSAAEFLQLGAGARAESLGEAYAAAAGGVDALYWNPAGLSRLNGGEATFMHAPYIDSSYYDYAALAHRAGPGAVAAGAQYFSAGAVPATDVSGNSIGTVTPYDLALSGGYGMEFSGEGPLAGAAAGLAGKMIRSRLATMTRTEAVDFGVLSAPSFDGRLRLGATLRNLGGSMTFGAVAEHLPMSVAVGASLSLVKNWLLLAQGEFVRNGGSGFAAGTEYRIPAGQDVEFSARLGFNARTVGDVPGFSALSAGLGLAFRGAAFDYAIVPMGDLGLTHRVSVTLRWGRSEPAPEPTPVTATPEPEAPPKTPGDSFEQREYAAKGREAVHDYAKAAEEWRAADALLEPDDARHIYAQTRLGESAARQGDAEEAISYYSRAIEFAKTRGMVDKRVVGAYLGLAQRLAVKGSTPSALRNLQKAYDLADDDAVRGRIKQHIEELRRAAH